MPLNRKLHKNCGVFDSSPNSAVERAGEVMRRLRLVNNVDDGGVCDEPGAYPERPDAPDCIHYLRTGRCSYGSTCRFNHPSNVYGYRNTGDLPERDGQPDCVYYLKTGTCKYGSTCKFHHPKDRKVDFSVFPNILGLPMRQDAEPCHYYMQTGLCKYGYTCKFHHPQPTSTANVLPAKGHRIANGNIAVVPSSNTPSVGEASPSSTPKAAYFSNSVFQLPQNYMPLIPSPPQGWNAFTANFNPFSMSNAMASPSPSVQFSVPYLPERPDQPECRYFMNYGFCKYGTDCKYHHPREKISQLGASSLSPLGLPLRPGQPLCSQYTYYGLCHYGSTCKFDHPVDRFSYAYGYGVPVTYPLYQKNWYYVPSFETHSSKSSKLSDWIKTGETASNNDSHSIPSS